jgi:hypothetical protein
MFIHKSSLAALIWLMLLLCVPLTAAASIGPKAQVPETVFDFGEVFEDHPLIHTFMINNVGAAPLEIREIDADCACTAADYDRSIRPGGQGKITLRIAPYSVLRQFTKNTKVFFNDPDLPMVTLSLKGYGKPFIEIQPSHVVRLRGKPGDDLRGQVRFTSHLPGPWEIKEFKTNIPQFIEVSLKAEQPGRVYVVEVRNKRQEPGNYAGVIDLFTTSEKRPRLIMRVFGELSKPAELPY